jgi:hypothetical protein
MNSVKELLDKLFGSYEEVAAAPSLEKMAQYADSVCIKNAKNEAFAKSQCEGVLDQSLYHLWNSTSLGNLSYMSLYGHPDYRPIHLRALNQYLEITKKSRVH